MLRLELEQSLLLELKLLFCKVELFRHGEVHYAQLHELIGVEDQLVLVPQNSNPSI